MKTDNVEILGTDGENANTDWRAITPGGVLVTYSGIARKEVVRVFGRGNFRKEPLRTGSRYTPNCTTYTIICAIALDINSLEFLTGAKGGKQAAYDGFLYCGNRKTQKV
eukprot:sb/3477421/